MEFFRSDLVSAGAQPVVMLSHVRFQSGEVRAQETNSLGGTGNGSFKNTLPQELSQLAVDPDLPEHNGVSSQ